MTEFVQESLIDAYKALYKAVHAVDTEEGHEDLREGMTSLLERLEGVLLPNDDIEAIWKQGAS